MLLPPRHGGGRDCDLVLRKRMIGGGVGRKVVSKATAAAVVEEWQSPPGSRYEPPIGSFRDYMSDITGEEEHMPLAHDEHMNEHGRNELLMIDSLDDDEESDHDEEGPGEQRKDPNRYNTQSSSRPLPPTSSSSSGKQRPTHGGNNSRREITSPPRTTNTSSNIQSLDDGTRGNSPPRTVSPFSPDVRRSNGRRQNGNLDQHMKKPVSDQGILHSASSRSSFSKNVNVIPEEFGQNDPAVLAYPSDRAYSLSEERIVSVLVHVRDPPAKSSQEEQEGRLPCVFPMAAFMSSSQEKASQPPSSPTSIVMAATDESRKMIVINPRAFGENVPNKVSMELLRKTVGRGVSSEDWAREYRFSKVLWPSTSLLGFHRLARAISQDLTAPSSIAHRTVFAYGHQDKKLTIFGTSTTDSVARSFSQPQTATPSDSTGPDVEQLDLIADRYGLVGLTLLDMIRFKTQNEEKSGDQCVIGLSMMEIAGDAFYDLTEKWSNRGISSSKTGNKEAASTLKLVYDGVSSGGVIAGLGIHEVDSLKSLGHHFRRAFSVADFKGRATKRGHIVATLYFYRSPDQFGSTTKVPVAHFVDLATPTSNSQTGAELSTAETMRNASVRKSVTALGATLRACLLRQAGNHVTLSFRESLLTQFLQKSIDHQDGRTILLTSVSPMIDQYEKSMEYLRFSHKLLERPGDPPKSPFDTLAKPLVENAAPSSPGSAGSEQSEHISLSEIDEKYHPSLLKTLTSDARQRLSKAGFQPNPPPRNVLYLSSHMTEASEATAPTTTTGDQHQYEEIDPGTFYELKTTHMRKHSTSTYSTRIPSPRRDLPMSSLPTPQVRNLSYRPKQRAGSAVADTSSTLSAMDHKSFASGDIMPDQYPSPITTDTGDNGAADLIQGTQNILASRHRPPRKDNPTNNSIEGKHTNKQRIDQQALLDEEERAMDDLSAELRNRMVPSMSDDQALDDLSYEIRERAQRGEGKMKTHSPVKSSSHSQKKKVAESAGPPSIVDENSDNDTVSQMGEIEATYVRLNRTQRANAEAISNHLWALKESEVSVVKRITAERDTLRSRIERLAREHMRDLTATQNELQELRTKVAKLTAEQQEFHQIAEEAVAGKEQLVSSLKEREEELHSVQAESDMKDLVNQQLSESLRLVHADLENHKEEITKQEHLITELQTSLSNYESKNKQHAQSHVQDQRRIAELKEELVQARNEVAQALEARSEAEKLMEESERNLVVAREELSDSVPKLEISERRISELEEENKRLRQEAVDVHMDLQDELKVKNDLLESRESEVRALSEQLEERAGDVTELAVAVRNLQVSQEEVERRCEQERVAKEQLQTTTEALQQAMKRMSDETMKRLKPIAQLHCDEQTMANALRAENKELRERNEHLTTRIVSLRQDLSRNDEGYRELLEQGGLSRDESREKLEDLALDLSLIVREMPMHTRNIDDHGFEGLEQHIDATEQMASLLLRVLWKRTRDLRERRRMGN